MTVQSLTAAHTQLKPTTPTLMTEHICIYIHLSQRLYSMHSTHLDVMNSSGATFHHSQNYANSIQILFKIYLIHKAESHTNMFTSCSTHYNKRK